jgi:hypothetical protein
MATTPPPDPVRTVTLAERRARLAQRQRVAPAHRAPDVHEATDSIVCLHATDPSTVHLSAWARVDGYTTADGDRALYRDRSLVKHMAMRRTIFVFGRDILPAVQAGASNRVATSERKRLVAEVEKAGLQRDGSRWLNRAGKAVLAALADGREASSTQLREEIPALAGSTTHGEGKSWGGQVPVGPRVLTVLSAEGLIVRGTNDCGWNTSRPRWARMDEWLGAPIDVVDDQAGATRLVAAWLHAFGPGTERDLVWWLGSTKAVVRRALADLEAVPVALEGSDAIGYLAADDAEVVADTGPWIALLPPLDPTTMGWFERDWYLGDHKADLFDSTGNGGPTIWLDGRIVGGWRQRDDTSVELQYLDDVPAKRRKAIEQEAARLTDWLDGTRVVARFPSPLSKARA